LDAGAEYAKLLQHTTRNYPSFRKIQRSPKAVWQRCFIALKNEATKSLLPGNNGNNTYIEVGKLMDFCSSDEGLSDKADVQNENPDWLMALQKIFHARNITPHG
jgi:Xaa-Pro aminopeptidase